MSNNSTEKTKARKTSAPRVTGRRALTKDDVGDVVKRLVEGEGMADVAKRHDVTFDVISQIKLGKTYKDTVTVDMIKRMNRGKIPSIKKRLSESDREKIREMVANEVNRDKIASIYNINKSTVWRISNKK